MNYIQILNLSNVLKHFADQKVPFSIILTKNSKKVDEIIKEYDEKRLDIINKFAVLDENGSFIGVEQADGTRKENPQTLDDIEIEDREGLVKALNDLDREQVDFTVEKIDLTKTYFDSEMKEKRTVEDFVNTNIEASVLNIMIELGLIEL